MKAREFNSLLHGLNYKISTFNIHSMLNKIQNKELSKEQIDKLKEDVRNLQEDLIIIDCSH